MSLAARSVWAVAFSACLVLTSGTALARQPAAAGYQETARGAKGMIVAVEPFAAEAGLEIFRQGGNAADAAVAVAFALAVTHPQAGNLGGGGFMLIHLADGTDAMVDFRETAPGAATADMYLGPDGKLAAGASTRGWRSAGVPGSVAGLTLALENYGTLPLETVMAPAIRLARKGFPVSTRLAAQLREHAPRLNRSLESRRIFLRDGKFFKPGDKLVQKDLARTLQRIARKGSREFYDGALAADFARESEFWTGLITREDLRGYRAVVRQPLRGSFRGYEVVTAPPPSSGGVALLEMLNMLEILLGAKAAPDEVETLHLVAEASRRAFADRARHLADTDFADVPVAGLVSKGYAAACAATISREKASASASLETPDPRRYGGSPASPADGGASLRREGDNTTHLSVMDSAGNAVALTTTLNDSFGNGITVPGLGFLLNNVMDDFTIEPGAPNELFQLVQSDANRIEPGKRPVSSMTPTLVLRDGKPVLALGSPGGGRIISAVTQVVLNRLQFGDDLALAIARPRLHHQWLPDALYVEEDGFTDAQLEALRARGHTVLSITELVSSWPRTVGRVTAVERNPQTGELYGVADPRDASVARGY
ncbi:MAG: gamma-glutamyltransferase [Candidatus Acidiferrales bacterium]